MNYDSLMILTVLTVLIILTVLIKLSMVFDTIIKSLCTFKHQICQTIRKFIGIANTNAKNLTLLQVRIQRIIESIQKARIQHFYLLAFTQTPKMPKCQEFNSVTCQLSLKHLKCTTENSTTLHVSIHSNIQKTHVPTMLHVSFCSNI